MNRTASSFVGRAYRRRLVTRVLQAATFSWLAMSVALIATHRRASIWTAVVLPGWIATIAGVAVASLGGNDATPSSLQTQAIAPPETRVVTFTETQVPVDPHEPRRASNPAPLASYENQSPDEIQCHNCGHIAVANAGESHCRVCSAEWAVPGPDGVGPDVLIRSWLHNRQE
jgi:hypothetical protein